MTQAIKIPRDLPSRLRLVGQEIYGERWIPRLAAEIGVTEPAIYRWLEGGGSRRDIDEVLLALVTKHEAKAGSLRLGLLQFMKRNDRRPK